MASPTSVAVALLVTALFLAGCVADGGGISGGPIAASTTGRASASVTVTPTNPDVETGSIEGTVVDQELRPIANATVLLPGLSLELVSDADGAFFVARLPIGPHAIEVHVAQFESQSKSVTVQAQQIANDEFLLAKLIVDDTYHSSLHHKFYIEFSWAPPGAGAARNYIGPHMSNQCGPGCVTNLSIAPRPVDVLFEGVWPAAATDAIGDTVQVNYNFLYRYGAQIGWNDWWSPTGFCSLRSSAAKRCLVDDKNLIDLASLNTTFIWLNVTSVDVPALQRSLEIWTTFAYGDKLGPDFTALPRD